MALTQTDGDWDPKYTRGHSCSYCESIFLDVNATREEHWIDADLSDADFISPAQRLGVSLRDMRTASLARCDFARFVLRRDREDVDGQLPEGLSPDDVQLCFEWDDHPGYTHVEFIWTVPRKHTYNSSTKGPTLDLVVYNMVTGELSGEGRFGGLCLVTAYQG